MGQIYKQISFIIIDPLFFLLLFKKMRFYKPPPPFFFKDIKHIQQKLHYTYMILFNTKRGCNFAPSLHLAKYDYYLETTFRISVSLSVVTFTK